MDTIAILIAFVCGIALGAVVVWLFWSRKFSESTLASTTERQSVLLLNERVLNKDQELQRLQTSLSGREHDLEQTKQRLSDLVAQLAAANERNLRLVELQSMLDRKDAQVLQCKDQITALERSVAEISTILGEERKNAAEKLALLNDAKLKFEDTFKGLSDSALNKNTETFMNIAKNVFDRYQESARNDLEHRQKSIDQLVKPLADSLKEVDQKMNDMEKLRTSAYELLTDQVGKLNDTQNKLQQALRAPATRGRWGEVQLRRVVEMAGMVEHCDFLEQETVESDEKRLRPDMVILLPEGKRVVVDSKVPLQAYLDALEAADDTLKKHLLEDHVRQLRGHIFKLAQKSYWEQFSQSPEFVRDVPSQ